jgi:uncharacterized protein
VENPDHNADTVVIGDDKPILASAAAAQRPGTDVKALELLVCPLTKAVLEYDAVRQELVSRRANLAYPIRSGVPLLTREAARNLDDPPPTPAKRASR